MVCEGAPFPDSAGDSVAAAKAQIARCMPTGITAGTRLGIETAIDQRGESLRLVHDGRFEQLQQSHRQCQSMVDQLQEVIESMLRRPSDTG